MTFEIGNAERKIQRLCDSGLATFFARLIYELTLSARAVSVGAKCSTETIEGLMAINQLQHLLSSQLLKIHAGSKDLIFPSDLVARFSLEPEVLLVVQHEVKLAFRAAIDSIGK